MLPFGLVQFGSLLFLIKRRLQGANISKYNINLVILYKKRTIQVNPSESKFVLIQTQSNTYKIDSKYNLER